MRVSLRWKFILGFIAFGAFLVATTSTVFYIAYRTAITGKIETDLTSESQRFSEFVSFSNDSISVEDSDEWKELEHIKTSPYARYIIITDNNFKTLRKTGTLADVEFQSYHTFRPTPEVTAVLLDIENEKYVCVIYPIHRKGRPAAYVLAAHNFRIADRYIDVFENTMIFSMAVVVLLGTIVAYFFVRRITKPMIEIIRVANTINLEHLDQRITLESPDEEIQNLVTTLNQLLDRLHRSFNQVNEFSSNVSHELRTPLTILRGNIEVALSRERTPEAYVEVLSDLLEEVLSVIKIVDGLLLLARGDARQIVTQKQRWLVGDIISEFSKDWEAIASLRHQTVKLSPCPPLYVQGDKNLLSQLFLNIITNASKYSPPDSVIEIEINEIVQSAQSYVKIMVRDHGIGIPAEDTPKVFERFYRVNKDRARESGGTGLGLAIVRMIVELHNGQIELESKQGHGTTISIFLPEASS
ncbi:MAG TPA: ATP-binding protein [bacterium]|nr:ATP-binding protein [bacterium]